jgi:membrane-associated PAP2 superfamily phosphatase/two-component sensor histidine kinase
MDPERTSRAWWWMTRAVVPILLLVALAYAVGHSRVDRASLQPFFDAASGSFPLRHTWFFQDVLHVGGRALVAVATALLIVIAVIGWRDERRREHARRFLFLATCVILTVLVAGAWKRLAGQVTPWHTVGFGGALPWPEPGSGIAGIGSPGAHAAAGFAWVSLYFVGASLGTRQRWLWLAPGLLLGLLFAVGQHARGAHPPSHEALSLAIAWFVASTTAVAFRAAGWLAWSEAPARTERAGEDDATMERAFSWLVAGSVTLLGITFYAFDSVSSELEGQYPDIHHVVVVVELIGMAAGSGVGAWLLVERIAAVRKRAARRVEEERERRLQLLGRMAASVAHEVRNPLHTLRLIVDEQRAEIPQLESHPLRREFESSLDRIDRAVELVYRLARPESGDDEVADLSAVTRESIVEQERATPGRVAFRWERLSEPAFVQVSPTDARIVVANLIRNASQNSPPGGEVTLDLRAQDADWSLCIRNRGVLRDGNTRDERATGLGLGVSISRQIVGIAGGTLDIAEKDGLVSCTLRLPFEKGADRR